MGAPRTRPGRRAFAGRAGLALAVLLLTAASASDPYQRYRAAHPGEGEEDLFEVAAGDSLDRVLAVVHHPELGVDPEQVAFYRIDGPALLPLPGPPEAASDGAGPLFVAVRQRCTPSLEGAHAPVFSSWFLLRDGALTAWSLQPYDPACRPEAPQFQAEDHADMRLVGGVVFRRSGVGPFRYGALQYRTWDDAFSAPTREGMLSRLEAAHRARPDDPGALNRLAVGLYAAGERDRALELLRRATERAPASPVPLRNLVVALRHRGELAEAAALSVRADALEGPAVGSGPPSPAGP